MNKLISFYFTFIAGDLCGHSRGSEQRRGVHLVGEHQVRASLRGSLESQSNVTHIVSIYFYLKIKFIIQKRNILKIKIY